MAQTPLGDIPGARFHQPFLASYASVASNGATSELLRFGPFAHDVRVRNFYWVPTGAAQGGHATSYRQLKLLNGGSAGAGTTVLGSHSFTASKASLQAVGLTLADTPTLASGEMLILQQITVGGAKDSETVLQAGYCAMAYEVL